MHIQEKLQPVHGNFKTLWLDRFDYKIQCIKRKTLQCVFGISRNKYTSRNFFHLSPQFEPAQLRHIDVEKEGIGHFFFRSVEGSAGSIKQTCNLNKWIFTHKGCRGV